MKSYHLQKQDGTRGFYANWSKSVRERQIPHDFTCSLDSTWYIEFKEQKKQTKNWNRFIDTEKKNWW